jgi:hypothetical protein
VASDVIESSSLESSISAVVSRVARLLVSSRVYNISISAMRLARLHIAYNLVCDTTTTLTTTASYHEKATVVRIELGCIHWV